MNAQITFAFAFGLVGVNLEWIFTNIFACVSSICLKKKLENSVATEIWSFFAKILLFCLRAVYLRAFPSNGLQKQMVNVANDLDMMPIS